MDLIVKKQLFSHSFLFIYVLREKRPIFGWKWMVLVVPAMGVLGPVAAVGAEARVVHAAIPHVATEGLHVTLHGVPTPDHALKYTWPLLNHQPAQPSSTSQNGEEKHHGTYPVQFPWTMFHVKCLLFLLCVSVSPVFCCDFIFLHFGLFNRITSVKILWSLYVNPIPFFTLSLSFLTSWNYQDPLSYYPNFSVFCTFAWFQVVCMKSDRTVWGKFVVFGVLRFFLSCQPCIYSCTLTFSCVSL